MCSNCTSNLQTDYTRCICPFILLATLSKYYVSLFARKPGLQASINQSIFLNVFLSTVL